MIPPPIWASLPEPRGLYRSLPDQWVAPDKLRPPGSTSDAASGGARSPLSLDEARGVWGLSLRVPRRMAPLQLGFWLEQPGAWVCVCLWGGAGAQVGQRGGPSERGGLQWRPSCGLECSWCPWCGPTPPHILQPPPLPQKLYSALPRTVANRKEGSSTRGAGFMAVAVGTTPGSAEPLGPSLVAVTGEGEAQQATINFAVRCVGVDVL